MMNSPMNKKKWIYSVVTAMVAVLVLFVCYINFVEPMKNEAERKDNELKSEEQVLALLQENNQNGEQSIESSVELQKQVPVQPHVQQLILDLNRAEIVSDSFIKTIGVAEGGAVAEQSEQTSAASEEEESTPMPDGLQKVTLSLAVQSPSYIELEKFISVLENLERITVVGNIAFSGPEEVRTVESTSGPLEYQVSLSAFYAAALEDLQSDLPRVDTVPPGKKKYPFYSSPDVTDSDGNSFDN